MKNVKNVKKNNKGFSLVELIVVIAIMAVLVGVLAPTFLGYVSKSRVSTDLQNAEEIANQISVAIAAKDSTITTGDTARSLGTGGNATITFDDSSTSSITVSKSKVSNGASWSFKIIDNQVHVYITPSAEGSSATELYPNQPTSGDWSN
jgi:type IV pilus assembly protein PilA